MSGGLSNSLPNRDLPKPATSTAESLSSLRLPSKMEGVSQLPDEVLGLTSTLYEKYIHEDSRVKCFKYSVRLSEELIQKGIPHKELRLQKPSPPGDKKDYWHYVLELSVGGKPIVIDMTQDQFHERRQGPGVFSRKEFLSKMAQLGYSLERERNY